MKSFISISSKNNFSWKIGSFGNSELIYGRTCLEVRRWFHAVLLSKIPTGPCAFSNTEVVACVVVVGAVVFLTHRSLCAFTVPALQSAATGVYLMSEQVIEECDLIHTDETLTQCQFPVSNLLPHPYAHACRHREGERVGLVLGLPPGKGLLGTVVLCAGTSHLSGVIPFVKTKDLLNSKQISWYKNLSVYSVSSHGFQ